MTSQSASTCTMTSIFRMILYQVYVIMIALLILHELEWPVDITLDFLLPLIPCNTFNDKCFFAVSMPVPFTRDAAETVCQAHDGVYEEGGTEEVPVNSE